MTKLNAAARASELNALLAVGLMSELDYMTAEEAERAMALEADLLEVAKAEAAELKGAK